MTAPEAAARDPREGRQHELAVFLRIAAIGVLALAAAGVVTGGRVRHDVGEALVVLLVCLPLVRLVWLLVRWTRKRDLRFAVAVAVLLGILALAALVGFLS